jgi:hypothetical protein
MPRYSTLPFLFDEVKSISITDLRKGGFLDLGASKKGILTWSINGEKTGRIGILVNSNNMLTVDYKCDGTPYNYDIRLTSIPSNLGIGNVWYFICPFTHKRCRKLHLISERFMHRSNLPSGMYESQIKSKTWRQMDEIYGGFFGLDKLYEELYSKHFKTHYKGKPTIRYLKMLNKIKEAENMTFIDIEHLLIL